MGKKNIIILLLLIISIGVNAQTFNGLYRNDYCKIKGISNERINVLDVIYNYDKDGLFLRSFGYPSDTINYFLIDDALDIIRKNPFYGNFINVCFKLNSNLYGFLGSSIIVSTSPYIYYLENLRLHCFDSIGNIISVDTIVRFNDDTLKWNCSQDWFLSDKSSIVCLRSYPTVDGAAKATKLIKIDTLGNVLSTKIFYHKNNTVDLCEMKNNIMFAINGEDTYYTMNEDCAIYYLNKETLEIEDSIKGYDVDQMTPINDSIFAYTFFYGSEVLSFGDNDSMSCFNLMNIKTKKTTPVQSRRPGGLNQPPFFSTYSDYKIIDFRTPDSIYAAYIVRNNYLNVNDANIEFVNFNINGDTNFTYKINFEDSVFKQIQGIKATADGGVIIAAYSGTNDAWLIKFKPSGLIGLTNVETQEQESIRVYPNPAKDYVNVDIECTNFKASDIELFDMQGRIVKKSKLNAKQGNRIDVSSLNAGAYTYNVSLNGKTISGKLIIGK